MSDETKQTNQPEPKHQPGHPNLMVGNPAWVKGGPSPNPGGKRKVLREIEDMIDSEFRTPETIREALTACKTYGFSHETGVNSEGGEIMLRGPDAGFAKIFFDRVLGPVKEIETDLSDAPPEVLEYIRNLQ